jgi:putative phosphoesterase
MRIGIISDTHSYLDPEVFKYFELCDEIWHAGDIGDISVIKQLAAFKPLRAVYGNIDDKEVRMQYPQDQIFDCSGMRVWITHIAGTPPRYTSPILAKLQQASFDLLVCGHSHILRVMRDKQHPPLLYINPGAAGRHGIHHVRTILRLEIEAGKITNMEAIELGLRGR